MYLLCEQQEIKEGRVDIPDALDPEENPDATEAELKNAKIGYFIEFDGYYNKEPELQNFALEYKELTSITNYSKVFDQKGYTIKNDLYYPEQKNFIKNAMQTIYDVVYDAAYNPHDNLATQPYHTMDADGNMIAAPQFTSPRQAIESVVDTQSLVDSYIINELLQDNDLKWSSFYMSLDMSETGTHLLTFTAPWDWDSALANYSGDPAKTNEFFSLRSGPGNPWFIIFLNQNWFWKMVEAKFDQAEKAGVFTGVIEMVNTYAEIYEADFAKNYEKWPQCLRAIEGGSQNSQAVNHQNQASSAAYVASWLSERIANYKQMMKERVALYQ